MCGACVGRIGPCVGHVLGHVWGMSWHLWGEGSAFMAGELAK
jgi:hypothetical protein